MTTRASRELPVSVIACMLLSLAGCSGVTISLGPECGETQAERLECLREVGFDSVDRLLVSEVDKESGMDTFIHFTLQGPPAAIDDALAAADFTAAVHPGPDQFQLDPVEDISWLGDLRSASDVWVDAFDVPIHRQILRGRPKDQPDHEVLLVSGATS